ncbi:plasma membrane-associated cation-binding protein 1 [Corylus avellana]|uniref:plasma membrane-associated cation-binding protein 1 n=1 Tax=Corylus avellana TaxID=13451 RepID=UPI00286A3C2A|nr:plasma membrane-associated cation-binding protein 1 [Corylus avellana]XP_059438611.1 plasma membrane-associated cation-binding protein 1 [Corylus avellana]
MGYWKSKVLPKIKKVFDKNGNKKAAAEACKSFDDAKEQINKEFEEKKTELQPKVVEIYEASSAEIKTFVKEPKEAGLKKHSVAVHKFIEELVAIEFPGSKTVSEASSKYGPALVPGPVLFVFEKVSTFIVTEEKVEVKEASGKEKEIIVAAEEEKKEEEKIEEVAAEAPEKAAETEPAAYTTEAAKVEAAEAPKP